MSQIFEKLTTYPNHIITDIELATLIGGTPDSRYAKIKRLLAQGKLLRIRKGLYCLTEKSGYRKKQHPFELAQYIYAPSYISFESALSYHGLIPEAVYTTTSSTTKRSKIFDTPLGIFTYLHLPEENFYIEVMRIKSQANTFFMANPWKAICDYVYGHKHDWRNVNPLIDSLRIELVDLPKLSAEAISTLNDYYKSKRITRFLKGVKKDLEVKREAI